MRLGDYIKVYRKKNKLSQREFAKKCDLSNGYISMLERGLNPKTKEPITPSLVQLKKLADGMSVTINDILLAVDDMPVDIGIIGEKKQPTGIDELSEAEANIIMLFRKLPPELQRSYPALLEATLKAQGLL